MFAPGYGNPWKLTLAQWNAILDRIREKHEEMTGEKDHLSKAMRMARRNRKNER